MNCPFCQVWIKGDFNDFIRHDIKKHGGLQRMKDTHDLACVHGSELYGLRVRCICKLKDYERIAKDVNE